MSSLFDVVVRKAKKLGPVGVALVEACDEAALSALSIAEAEGFVKPYLIGQRERVEKILQEKDISLKDPSFVDARTQEESAFAGTRLVREGVASILMKGKIPTPSFLHAVLDKERGLRTGKILSHVACLEVPGFTRFIFVTDGGVVLHPDLEKKVQIINNAIEVARVMGVETPKIACLAPSEIPSLDSEASVHAAILAKMSDRGLFPGAIVDGPMALDVAVSPESARIKGVTGPVAGNADVLLAPDVVSGNSIAKSMQYFAKAVMGGVIVGALVPLVVISRADTSLVKLNSLAIARCVTH
ncbi:MAG: bifunctional enoyl-CoA hydratase/phosphate acetyltransferase [Candidatus Fermentithermobacillus carboniphilus]|uniref:Bifunctional enoyl-CoA hydratase/phosphate acetyltransferase n=1 Tax=Candidatus Fermentithermobacillus carboniphilus TaxID=3085328 RepID=A0AAT9LFI0_9FIRM|nr:MAG: bifunctional enoyl-CoA hydratase/phosphate acetyltransferase [Candidatus Fermentithermobacillus carboniphilus]